MPGSTLMRRCALCAAGLISLFVLSGGNAFAIEGSSFLDTKQVDQASWYVGVGAIYSDNVARSDTRKQSNVSPKAEFGGIFVSNRERLTTELSANLGYVTYPNSRDQADTRSTEETSGAVRLNLVGAIIPRRFMWHVQDNYGIVPVNLANPDSQFNRQRTNVFETGPVVILPVGTRNELKLTASWFTSSFGESNSDGTGERASASLIRHTSLESELSVNASASKIRYADSLSNRDFELRSAFLAWSRSHGRSTTELQLGVSELRGDGIGQTSPTAQISFRRQISRRSSLAFSAGREFSSSALAFQSNQSFFGVSRNIDDIQVAADPFRSDFGRLAWQADGERLGFYTQVNVRRDKYDSNPLLNVKLYGMGASVVRRVSSKLRIDAGVEYRRRQFASQDLTTQDRSISLGLGYIVSPSLDVTIGAKRNNAVDPRQELRSTENSVQLRLTYRSASR